MRLGLVHIGCGRAIEHDVPFSYRVKAACLPLALFLLCAESAVNNFFLKKVPTFLKEGAQPSPYLLQTVTAACSSLAWMREAVNHGFVLAHLVR